MPHIQHLRGRRRSAMKPSTSVEMAGCAAPCTSRTSTPITVALRTGCGISMASPPSIWRIIWVGDGQSTYGASTRPRASSEQRWGFSTANGESAFENGDRPAGPVPGTKLHRRPRRNIQPFDDRRARLERGRHPLHFLEIAEAHQLARAVKTDQVGDPGEGGDVGDAVLVAQDPLLARQLAVQHAQQAPGFVDVALQGAFVFEILAGEFVEEAQ